MSEEIIKILDALGAKFGVVIDWTSENVLPYAKDLIGKYVSYELATSVAYIVLWIVLSIIGMAIARWSYHKADDEDLYIPLFIISGFCAAAIVLTCIIVGFVQTMDIIKCIAFPEKVIIDWLVRQGGVA